MSVSFKYKSIRREQHKERGLRTKNSAACLNSRMIFRRMWLFQEMVDKDFFSDYMPVSMSGKAVKMFSLGYGIWRELHYFAFFNKAHGWAGTRHSGNTC